MSTAWADIPEDAIVWFRSLFANVNSRVTERLINVPNIRETSLDDGFVEAVIPFTPPRELPSGAVVGVQVHNIGGLRSYRSWEVADIAVLVFVYRRGSLLAQKIGLLQSKRLFARNNEVEDDDPVSFAYGLNAFLHRDQKTPLGKIHRVFDFDDTCTYGSLKAGSDQVRQIDDMNQTFGDAVYYLFYNPPTVPASVRYPVTTHQSVHLPPLGCRVYTAAEVHAVLSAMKDGSPPSLLALQQFPTASNWRLEVWASDLLMRCKVGQEFGPDRAEIVGRLLERRSGPIAAAIAISIVLPEAA